MRYLGLLLLALTACDDQGIAEDTDLDPAGTDVDDNGSDADTDIDIDTSDPANCTAALASTDPTANHNNFPTNTPLTAWFTAAVSSGEFSLSVEGVTGSTELAADGMSATFTPGQPLANETNYTFTTSVCGNQASTSFRTAAAPLEEEALTDRTYAMDYDDVTWVSPSAISSFSSSIPVEYILLHIAEANATDQTIDAIGSLGIDGTSGVEQDTCQDTFGFGPQDFATNPVFRVGPTTLTFPANGDEVSMYNAFIEAVFVEDGDAIENIAISGTVDTRDFEASVGLGDLCALVQLFGDQCTTCPDGETKCLDAYLTVDRAPAMDIDFQESPTPGPECN